MFLPNRQKKRSDSKSTAKVVDKRKKSEPQFKIDDGLITVTIVWTSLVVWYLFVSSITSSERVAEVGDMLDFHADDVSITAPNTAVQAKIAAGPWASPDRTCELDVGLMEKPGGVMSVTAVRPDGVLLSWTGGATAGGKLSCKGNEPILVENAGYGRLQMALARGRRDPR